MAQKVRAAVLLELNKLELQEFDKPEIRPEDGLLWVEQAGVCASDPGWYKGKLPVGGLPIILGHEILGRIAEIGSEASRKWGVKAGDRVVVEGSTHCDHCYYCVHGQYHLCENRVSYGSTVPTTVKPALWGAYAEYMYLAPGSLVHQISDQVPAEGGVLVGAVLANAIRWVSEFGRVRPGDAVVVQGVGPQGLSAVIAARECGAGCVIATGLARDRERLALAREFGAQHTIDVEHQDVAGEVAAITGRGADMVIDLTGSPSAVATALDLVRKQGRIVQAGVTGSRTLTPLYLDKIIFKEVSVSGVFAHTWDSVEAAVRLVESRRYPVEKMVTHHFPLDEAEHAIHCVAREVPGVEPIKAVLTPNGVGRD